jgi:hypothetical protein
VCGDPINCATLFITTLIDAGESRRSRLTKWNCDTIRLCETVKFIKYTLVIFISMHNSMRSATIGTEQCNDLRTSIDCRLNRRSCANAMHQRECLMRAINMIGKSIAALIRHGKQRNNHLSVDID